MPITPTNPVKHATTFTNGVKSIVSVFTNSSTTKIRLLAENSDRLLCENSDFLIYEGSFWTNLSKS